MVLGPKAMRPQSSPRPTEGGQALSEHSVDSAAAALAKFFVMNEMMDNFTKELRAKLDAVDKRIKDLNTSAKGRRR
jgi:hypothetical protein